MKIIDVAQGSKDWKRARAGLPTASQFGRICTPGRMEYASGATSYIAELLREQVDGRPMVKKTTAAMEDGTFMEPQVLDYYAITNSVELEFAGFCLADSGKYGCSPDALVKGQSIGVEGKAPELHTHIGWLIDDVLPTAHKIQVLGNLLVTGYERWDFISYRKELKPLIIEVYRDDVKKDLQVLEGHVDRFCNELIRYRAKIGYE